MSIWHILLVLVVVVIIFGAGRLPKMMGDLALGIKSFKRNIADPPTDTTTAAKPADPITPKDRSGPG